MQQQTVYALHPHTWQQLHTGHHHTAALHFGDCDSSGGAGDKAQPILARASSEDGGGGGHHPPCSKPMMAYPQRGYSHCTHTPPLGRRGMITNTPSHSLCTTQHTTTTARRHPRQLQHVWECECTCVVWPGPRRAARACRMPVCDHQIATTPSQPTVQTTRHHHHHHHHHHRCCNHHLSKRN